MSDGTQNAAAGARGPRDTSGRGGAGSPVNGTLPGGAAGDVARPRPTLAEMQTLAGRAVGRINLWGTRGITDVRAAEIEAMATLLFLSGLPPIAPNTEIGEPVALRGIVPPPAGEEDEQ